MASTADYRNTQFETARIIQGSNGVGVEMLERGVHGSAPPPMKLEEGADLDDATVAAGIAFFTGVEQAYARRYAALVTATQASSPAAVHALVATAQKAQADAAAAQAATDTAQAQKEALEAEHAALSLKIALMQTQAAALAAAEPEENSK